MSSEESRPTFGSEPAVSPSEPTAGVLRRVGEAQLLGVATDGSSRRRTRATTWWPAADADADADADAARRRGRRAVADGTLADGTLAEGTLAEGTLADGTLAFAARHA
ncbi:hypothetical protein [Nonomuraea pusilla]|uniref:hypothetical protein n=1 Tax=Nonomuraea pusilla TaxID=46177 RepID=UPI000B8827BA|nr:hypothetical protein [Nonomuraea pusilla]